MKHLNYNFSPAYYDFRANYMHVHVLLKDNGQTPKVILVKFNVIIVQVSLVTLWCQHDRGMDGQTDNGQNELK